MTAPRIWKNKRTARGQQQGPEPAPCHLQSDGHTATASVLLPHRLRIGDCGVTSFYCFNPSLWPSSGPHRGPPRSAHLPNQSVFQILASHPWVPLLAMMVSVAPALQEPLDLRVTVLPPPPPIWDGPSQLSAWLITVIISGRPSLAPRCPREDTHLPCSSPGR